MSVWAACWGWRWRRCWSGGQQLGIPAGLNLFAPLGASAVLLFAVHTSPLAQPWSCVVGNTVAGLWTWLVVSCVPLDWAPALAVGGAIMVMQLTRSLHPPGGAVALLWALDAQHGTVHGWTYALWPIGVLTLCLVLVAIVYHRVCGKRYPLQPVAMSTAGMQQLPTKALSEADLQALLSRFDQSNNLTAQELQQLVLAAEEQAIARRFGSVHCGQLMTTAMWTCSPQESLDSLAAKFQQHPIKACPSWACRASCLAWWRAVRCSTGCGSSAGTWHNAASSVSGACGARNLHSPRPVLRI